MNDARNNLIYSKEPISSISNTMIKSSTRPTLAEVKIECEIRTRKSLANLAFADYSFSVYILKLDIQQELYYCVLISICMKFMNTIIIYIKSDFSKKNIYLINYLIIQYLFEFK